MILKTTRTILAAAIMTVASSTAFAQSEGPPPNLSVQEKGLFSLVEMAASITAAQVDRQGCGSRTYSFSGSVNFTGAGAVTLDDLRITTAVTMNDLRGTFFQTDIPVEGELGSLSVRRSPTATRHAGYVGDFRYSRRGEIAYGDAEFDLNVNSFGSVYERHDEHIIKDFFRSSNVFGGLAGVEDRGLEVITKLDYPRAKWRQVSEYYRPDGGIGLVSITKTLIAPDNAAGCQIQLNQAMVDDFGDGLQITGTLTVQRLD